MTDCGLMFLSLIVLILGITGFLVLWWLRNVWKERVRERELREFHDHFTHDRGEGEKYEPYF